MSKWVVHCKRSKYDRYIGRPTDFGNPFVIGQNGTRAQVVKMYRDWLLKQPKLLERVKAELKGQVLGCWCAPEACHGDVLAEIANETTMVEDSEVTTAAPFMNNTNFKLLDVVSVIKSDYSEQFKIGTIVEVLAEGVYEVEFSWPEDNGRTSKTLVLKEPQLMRMHPIEEYDS